MADNGQNGQSRLDRIEAIIEALASHQAVFEDEFSRLLRAQVLMVDAQQKTEQKLQTIGENLQALAEAQRHTDESLNALIAIVDDIVRRPPPPQA